MADRPTLTNSSVARALDDGNSRVAAIATAFGATGADTPAR